MTRRRPAGLAVLAALALAGCAFDRARPLDAVAVEARLRDRTLADPGLRAFVDSRLPSRPLAFPPAAWDLEALTLVAFYYHPDLDLARARAAAAEAAVLTAGGRPNPTIDIAPGISPSAGSPWLLAVSLDIPVETAGKRGYRIARAERLSLAARLDLAEAGWRVRSRLRAALAEYGAAARAVDLLRAEEAARSDATALVERRLAAGAASRPDLDRARLDLARTRLDLRVAEGRAAEARSALAGALGVPLAALDGASFRWPEPEALPPAEALPLGEVRRAGLLNRIDVRRGLEEYAAAEAALALELAKRYPDVRFAPGYEFDGGANKFRIGLSIELPVLNRNEGPIAEAEARRAEKAAAFTALEARAVEEIETALARYRGARAELSEAEALLDAERAREDAVARAVAAGAADRLELALARVEGAVLARARLDALLKAHLALGALEDAVEQPLAPRVPLPEAFPAPERRETSAQERGAPEPSVGSVCSVPTTSDEADP